MDSNDRMWAQKTPSVFKGKHPDWYWVSVDVPLTETELLLEFGPACRTYDRECPCCRAWRRWRKTGRATILVVRAALFYNGDNAPGVLPYRPVAAL